MRATLPETAIVKTWDRGEQPVSSLVSGDRVIGYNVSRKDLEVLRVAVEPLPPEPVLQFFLQHFRWINLFGGTEIWTSRGLQRAADQTDPIMGYCIMNPRRMAIKVVVDVGESAPIPGVVLSWDSADLLWSEGLLIGATG